MHAKEIKIIQQQEQESNENYTRVVTFNQWLYEKIIAEDLSLKDPAKFMKKVDDFLTKKLIRYFKLYITKQAVLVQNL